MRKILFMGLPGAGKGTQAKLMKKYGFVHIDIGEVIRKSRDPKVVRWRKKDYKKGLMLPDEVVFELIEKKVKKVPKKSLGYIIDGGGTLPEAKFYCKRALIEEVIFFYLSRKEATKRILNRHEGRSDDNLKTVKERFIVYDKKTKPAMNYLKTRMKFKKINSTPPIKKVHKEVLKALKIKPKK